MGTGVRVDVAIIELHNLDDTALTRDEFPQCLSAFVSKKRPRHTNSKAAAGSKDLQGTFDKQHVEIEVAGPGGGKSAAAILDLALVAPVELCKAHKGWGSEHDVRPIRSALWRAYPQEVCAANAAGYMPDSTGVATINRLGKTAFPSR